jgi:alkylhydroperoxidase family enzyme
MPWIKTMTEESADPELREVYEHIKQQRGQARADNGPPNLHSLNPKAMRHTADLMWEIMRGDSRLTTVQREMIATVTSVAAGCEY